jgi:hypothetical protein
MDAMKTKRTMTKKASEHLDFLADALTNVSNCTEEQWRRVCGRSKDETLRHIAAALRNAARR